VDWRIVEPLLKLLPERFHVPSVGGTPSDVVLEVGRSRLLRYRPAAEPVRPTPILLVPSLVNRHTILDLVPGRSVVETLRNAGLAVYMLDWGIPGPEDASTTLDDLIFDRLDAAVRLTAREHGRSPTVLGYCMGGTMALVYAASRPDSVANLILLATPVDFDHVGLLTRWARNPDIDIDDMVQTYGLVPPSVFQPAFTLLRPAVITRKWLPFIQFANEPAKLQAYLPMFRWATENVPLPGPVIRSWTRDYFVENRLVKRTLVAGGNRVDLGRIRCPVLNLIALLDHIVEPASPRAVAPLLAQPGDYTEQAFQMGHVELSMGFESGTKVMPAMLDWLKGRS
jgi:polyhydroxyalkanoate synthase